MKGIVEFNGYRTRIACDRKRGEFGQVAEVHPFTGREHKRAKAAVATVVTIDRGKVGHRAADADEGRPRPQPLVPLAWMRMPDARVCLPVGPCMPMPAKRYFQARHGHHVRVRCRLPDIDGLGDEPGLVE